MSVGAVGPLASAIDLVTSAERLEGQGDEDPADGLLEAVLGPYPGCAASAAAAVIMLLMRLLQQLGRRRRRRHRRQRRMKLDMVQVVGRIVGVVPVGGHHLLGVANSLDDRRPAPGQQQRIDLL